MITLLQRVTHANVKVNNKILGEIKQGLLVFVGVEKNDTKKDANRLLERILGYRIFADKNDQMNLSVKEINGGILFIPQFTLAADTKKGMRPSFTPAASPEKGQELFEHLTNLAQQQHKLTAIGKFGANMQVSLCNDGPVTFILQTGNNT